MIVLDQLKRSDRQLRLLTAGVLAGLGILLSGLWFVQVLSSQRFKQREQTQSFRTVRIPAIRGKILDRWGNPLADNRPSYNLNLYLEELRPLFVEEFGRQRPIKAAPAAPFWKSWLGVETPAFVPVKLDTRQREALNGAVRYAVVSNIMAAAGAELGLVAAIEPVELREHYQQRRIMPVLVSSGLTPDRVARMLERGSSLPGLDLEIQPLRSYPRRTLACHVLGYVHSNDRPMKDELEEFRYRLPDYRGDIGIERAFDKELRGHAGMKAVLVNSAGYRQSENVWLEAEPGMNVVLALDLSIQKVAEDGLHNAGAGTQGAVVVMDANTGDIYAMASTPVFDPNFAVPRISTNDWRALNDDPQRPFINRALQENFSPGSIFKIVTSMALLENGLNTNEIFKVQPDPNPRRELRRYGHGAIKVGNQLIEDTVLAGDYNFKRAFIKSSNSYFIHHTLQMKKGGSEEIFRIAQALHVGERAGIPTMQEVPGNLPTPAWRESHGVKSWSDGDTANLCIGQGMLDTTPVQMAVAYAAVANGGRVLTPRLVMRVEPQDALSDQPAEEFPGGVVRNTLPVSQRTLSIIRDAMLADTEDAEGTGERARVDGWRVCGKTGTAENDKRRSHGKTTWFASFAPYESPRYVVIVMIEGGGSGGITCAPIAGQILRKLKERENPRPAPAAAALVPAARKSSASLAPPARPNDV